MTFLGTNEFSWGISFLEYVFFLEQVEAGFTSYVVIC